MASLPSMEDYERINEGPFSFEQQFEKITNSRLAGQKMGLVIGRTVREGLDGYWMRSLPSDNNQKWAYLDLGISHGEDPHFIMDVTDVETFQKKFPSNTFNKIVFDASVIDYVFQSISAKHQEDIFKEFVRILEPEGKLSFNARQQSDCRLADLGMLIDRDIKETWILPVYYPKTTAVVNYDKLIDSLRIELMIIKGKSLQPELGHTLRMLAYEIVQNSEPKIANRSEVLPDTIQTLKSVEYLSIEELLTMAEDTIANDKDSSELESALSNVQKIRRGNYIQVKNYIVQRLGDLGFKAVYLSKTAPWTNNFEFFKGTGRYFHATKTAENESVEKIDFTEDKVEKEPTREHSPVCTIL